MPISADPTLHLGHEITQDCIQFPHLVNPVTWIVEQGTTVPHMHYNAPWGDGTGHRVLFFHLAFMAASPAVAPTYGGQSMTPVGTPNTDGGLWYLTNPATSGDFDFDNTAGSDDTTATAVMFVGAQQIAPADDAQYTGTWDSTSNLGIGVPHGSRQSVLTFVSFRKDHGVISCSDDLVLRPGEGELRTTITLSPTVFGAGTHTATYAGSVAESGDYNAYGVSLFQVAAGNGFQDVRLDQELRIYPYTLGNDESEAQALRRLPSQFDKSAVLRNLVGGVAHAADEASRAVGGLTDMAAICASYQSTLDAWGAKLGVSRRVGDSVAPDRIYRRRVLAGFLAGQSSGTYSEIREVAGLLFPGATFVFTEPGSDPNITITVDQPLDAVELTFYQELLNRATAPAVPLTLVSSP